MAYLNPFQSIVLLSFFILQGANLLAGNTQVVNGSGESSSGSALPSAPAVNPPTGLVAQRQPGQEEELEWEIRDNEAWLRDHRANAAQFESLFRRLPSSVTRLVLCNQRLTGDSVMQLAAWFRAGNGANLRHFALVSSDIDAEGVRRLAAIFEVGFLTNLETLQFELINIHDLPEGENESLTPIFQVMTPATLTRLTQLHLGFNGIPESSIAALTNMFRDHQALEHLNLRSNSLGDGEITLALLAALESIPTLRILDLSKTGIGNTAIQALENALGRSWGVRDLAVARYVRESNQDERFRNLEELYIEGNAYAYDGFRSLEDTLRRAGRCKMKYH